ncbi:MAG: DUF790 family protein [bacterium]
MWWRCAPSRRRPSPPAGSCRGARLQAATSSVGESREAFREAVGEVPVGHADQRVFAGLTKLVTDRCTFEMDVGHPPATLRAEVFAPGDGGTRQALDPLQPFDRASVIAEVGHWPSPWAAGP